MMKRDLPVVPTSPLPPLYDGWVAQLLGGPIPPESDATCDDCAMCAGGGGETAGSSEIFFDPRSKCCTYVPELPNYLLGRILSDDDPATATGRATVEARLRAGAGVTPLGVASPAVFTLLYERAGPVAFGRSQTLRCPHYLAEEGGRCGVWRNRASVCATWFCKYVRGATGQGFWAALHQLLSGVERSLARWCVLQMEVEPEVLRRLFPPRNASPRSGIADGRELDGEVDPAVYRRLWGVWAGREAEFYRECARRVDALAWEDVEAIGGAEVQVYARLTREAYRRLTSEETPGRLTFGGFRVAGVDRDTYRINSYSGYDPLELPRALVGVLPYFDGRPTAQVLDDIAASEGFRLSPELVLKLADFRVLVPPEPEA